MGEWRVALTFRIPGFRLTCFRLVGPVASTALWRAPIRVCKISVRSKYSDERSNKKIDVISQICA